MKKNIVDRLYKLYFYIPYIAGEIGYKLCKKDPCGNMNRCFVTLCKIAEQESDYYLSYRARPKYAIQTKRNYFDIGYSCVGLVMQGPLLKQGNFTINTIKFYKKMFPGMKIVISTWDDEDINLIKKIRNLGVIVIQSRKPLNSGRLNINYQIESTRRGVEYLNQNCECEYICKTRTDQRIYNSGAFLGLLNLIETFPVNNCDFELEQNKRIICCSMEYENLFFPYFISDFLYFGEKNDIKNLFLCEMDDREYGGEMDYLSKEEIAKKNLAPEIQLLRNYIEKNKGNSAPTIKAYWDFVKNHLVLLNKDELGIYWPKYEDRYVENQRNGYFHLKNDVIRTPNFDFLTWLGLYNGMLRYDEKYESYLKKTMPIKNPDKKF